MCVLIIELTLSESGRQTSPLEEVSYPVISFRCSSLSTIAGAWEWMYEPMP